MVHSLTAHGWRLLAGGWREREGERGCHNRKGRCGLLHTYTHPTTYRVREGEREGGDREITKGLDNVETTGTQSDVVIRKVMIMTGHLK